MGKFLLYFLSPGVLMFSALAGNIDSSRCPEVNGWQDAKWDMTPDAVRAALKSRAKPADLSKVCGEKCQEGAALEVEDFEMNNAHFTVRLWFTASNLQLHTVSMYAKPSNNDQHSFTTMKNFFDEACGPATSTKLQRGRFIISWALPNTTITLYANTTNELTIIYDKNLDEQKERQ